MTFFFLKLLRQKPALRKLVVTERHLGLRADCIGRKQEIGFGLQILNLKIIWKVIQTTKNTAMLIWMKHKLHNNNRLLLIPKCREVVPAATPVRQVIIINHLKCTELIQCLTRRNLSYLIPPTSFRHPLQLGNLNLLIQFLG